MSSISNYRRRAGIIPYATTAGIAAHSYGPAISRGVRALSSSYRTWRQSRNSSLNSTLGSIRSAGSMNSRRSAREARNFNRRTNLRAGRAVPLATAQQVPVAGGESKSFFRLAKPLPKAYYGPSKFLGVNSVNRSSGFNAVSVQGKQQSTNLGAYFNSTDITNIFTDVGETSTPTNSGKVLLMESRAKAFITNSETTNCHFTIYEVMSRQDGGALNTDPSTTFLAGCADANGGASTDATIPGTSPFSNPRFLEAYKILQKSPIILAPGMTHVHEATYVPNRIVSQERQIISGIAGGPLGQLTIWTFIIQHGTPVHGSAAITTVTLGSSSLDIVLLEEIKFKQMVRDYSFNSISTTLATALATPEQVAQATDAEVLETHS